MRCTLPTELVATLEHIYVEWALVYPTMSVLCYMCQINQVSDKPGVG